MSTTLPSIIDDPQERALIDRGLALLGHWWERLRAARAEAAAPATIRSWDAEQRRETLRFGPLDQRRIGVRPIDVRRIVGSVGAADDMDGRFQPRSDDPLVLNRFRNVCRAMRSGDDLQPITVRKLRRTYYVVDGRHRVGAAKRLGWDTLAADVTVFLPSGDRDEVALYHERRAFEAATELLVIEAARPGSYAALRCAVDTCRRQWNSGGEPYLDLPEASLRWYYRVFVPAITVVRGSGIRGLAPTLCCADIVAFLLAAECSTALQAHDPGLAGHEQAAPAV